DMVTTASTYLFETTEKRFFFKNVSILIPENWKENSEYKRPKHESYEHVEMIHTPSSSQPVKKKENIFISPPTLYLEKNKMNMDHQVVEFCNEKNHNREAPSLQNKMCNSRSIWEVISNSEDFKSTTSMVAPPPPPVFSLLKISQRIACLVLDTSGSMG
ncbi:hypothetical protein HPG69_010984, partial [Diceros bicornis minor]